MRVYRVYYKDKNAKKKQVKKWWIELRDHLQTIRRFPAFTDKRQSEALGRQIDKLVSSKIAGQQPDAELSRWLEGMPEKLRGRFVKIGLLDTRRAAAGKLLAKHLDDFQKSLEAKGRGIKYIKSSISTIKRIFNACRFSVLSDITASSVEQYLAGLRDGEKRISSRTFNANLKALKQFANWLVKDGRASDSPLKRLDCLNERTDRRHDRRALTSDEIRRLLETTAAAPERFGMTGYQRTMLYRLAVETGLRAGELKSLTVSSFDFEKCIVLVMAAYSKNRKQSTTPLRRDTVALLKDFFSGNLPHVRAFAIPDKPGKMLQADEADAGIDYVDDSGRYADFHSLRHTFITNLQKAPSRVAQSLARHASSAMTDRYTHIRLIDERQAIEDLLPNLSLPSSQQQVATGTEDENNLAQNLAFSGGKQCISMDGNGLNVAFSKQKVHSEAKKKGDVLTLNQRVAGSIPVSPSDS